jgi:3',5'-cyclic AMP phosphodiesterase CpdA
VTFLLAHLSDVHLGPVPQPRPLDLVGKRLAGYMNWKHARVHTQNMDVLALIVADMKAQSPDHIAITGDIVNIALPAEFPLGRQWIESIGSGENVSFVPGNHDAYVASAMQDLETTFAPWTLGETSSNSTYPYLRVKEHVALIGLTSGVPTPPFMASGTLGRAQMEACETLLKEAGARGLARVVMLHHPPHKTGASVGRGLTDASAFEAMIRRTGAELILHGHNHRLSVAQLAGPKRAVPVVGVASGSAIGGTPGHRAGYNLFEIERAGDGFKIAARMRGLLPQADTQAHVIGGLGEIALQAS